MSNLQKRVLSSIAFVVLILGPLFIGPRWAYSVYAVLGWFTLREFSNILDTPAIRINKIFSSLLYLALVLLVYEVSFEDSQNLLPISLGLGVIMLVSIVVEIFRSNEKPLSSLSTSIFAPLYTAASFLGLAYFLGYRTDLIQPWIIVSVFVLIWFNDSAAYLIGRQIGKTKLIEHISPNKTWEGSISGLVASLVAGYFLSYIPGMPAWPIMIGFALVAIVGGSLGDLFESRLKRAAGVKDSGTFLPGHGGFLDRFDAMMLAVPFVILYFELVFPKT